MAAEEWSIPPWEVTGEPKLKINLLKWTWRWRAYKAALAARQKKDSMK
jgi:hypothetical protein